MVREFEPQDTLDTVILAEPWVPAPADAAACDCVETLLSFAATLCVHVSRQPNARLILIVAGASPVILHGQANSRLLESTLCALALTEGSPLADLMAAVSQPLPISNSPAQIWVIATRPIAGRLQDLTERLRVQHDSPGLRAVDVGSQELDFYFRIGH